MGALPMTALNTLWGKTAKLDKITFCGYGSNQFLSSRIPESDSFVTTCCSQLVPMARVPGQLIHTITVSSKYVVLYL